MTLSNQRDQLDLAAAETEQRLLETFPLDIAPEEFAARDGYGWLDFPFDRFRYRNPKLDAWIARVGEIIKSPELLKKYQDQYLTPMEKRMIRRYLEDDDERLDGD